MSREPEFHVEAHQRFRQLPPEISATQTFDSEVSQLKDAGAEGIVIIGFAESARILALMVQKGIGPANVHVYGVDGNMGNTLGSDFEAGIISK